MNGLEAGIVGGVLGSVIGVLGAGFGVWNSLCGCKTVAERRVIWQLTLVVSLMCALMLAGLFLIPKPYNWLVWLPYPIILIGSITKCNKSLAALRAEQPPVS